MQNLRAGGIGEMDMDMERALFTNDLQSMHLRVPPLPWEVGVFKEIFGDDNDYNLPGLPAPNLPPLLRPDAEQEEEADVVGPVAPDGMPVYAKHVKALTDRDYEAATNLEWTKGLVIWLAIIEGASCESLVGRHVEEHLKNRSRDGALQSIRDACGIRSPSTVLKRARDLQCFVAWCKDDDWWPLDEKKLLDYIMWTEATDKSKLIGKNLKHALRFFKHVMGAHFDEEEVLGPVFRGRVGRIGATKSAKVQARALTVDELMKLENILQQSQNLLVRYYVGCMLFCIYSRARWSDIRNVESLEWDVVESPTGVFGFIETRTRVTKTSTTEEKKTMYMPFVAPVVGLLDSSWGMTWKNVLERLGFEIEHRPFGPLCRAPKPDGSFTKRSITTAEASAMLAGYLEVKGERMTSHSMKATTLVWAARYGLSERTRAILGHHALKEDSMACYSRDLMTAPTRELCAMLQNIRSQRFKPDSTRSGWLASRQENLHIPGAGDKIGTPAKGAPSTPWFAVGSGGATFDVPDEEFEIVESVKEASPETPSILRQGSEALTEDEMKKLTEEDIFGPNSDDDEEIKKLKIFARGGWPGEEMECEEPEQGEDFVDTASSSSEDDPEDETEGGEEFFYRVQAGVTGDSFDPVITGNLIQNTKSKYLHRAGDEMGTVTKCNLSGRNFVHLPRGSLFYWPMCSKCFREEAQDTKSLSAALESAKKRRLAQ